MSNIAQIELPSQKLVDLFSGEARYRVCWGGRGSGKTRSFALMAAVYGYKFGKGGRRGQILCAREHLNSLADSSFEEIKSAILSVPWLSEYYDCGDRYIKSKDGNIVFTFSGLRHNLDSVKSMAKILLCWVDEAANVSEEAWVKLVPTIREEDSEIFVSWNPERKDAPVEQRFRFTDDPLIKKAEVNYDDNKFFPAVLEQERQRDKAKRPELYDHIWEGGYLDFVHGSYLKDQLMQCKDEGRIKPLPRLDSQPAMSFWDIGNSDGTAIWIVQKVGHEYRCIDFYESWGTPYSHATKWLQSLNMVWDTHYLPHDAGHKRQGQTDNKSPQQMLSELMPNSSFEIVPRIQEINWGIQQLRDMFPVIWFDEDKCSKGLDHLHSYRRKWSENEKRWLNKPDKSEGHSEAADAIRQMAQVYAKDGFEPVTKKWGSGALKRNLAGIA